MLNRQNGEKKKLTEKTEKLTLTVELPKNVHKLLEKLAAFADVTVEDILRDELKKSLPGFWQNEMFQAWAKKAIKETGCAEYFEIRE